MARGPRIAVSGVPLHVIQRGNNRSPCFDSADDYRLYLGYLRDAAARFGCAVHAYVLMTNHVHLLVTPLHDGAISRLMQQLGRRYVRSFNERHARTGTLWEGRFRSSVIDSERYFLVCHRYIEQNPVRAGLVREPADYPWSSYRHYGEGAIDPLVSPHACSTSLGSTATEQQAAHRKLCGVGVANEELERIRSAINRGKPLATDEVAGELQKAARTRERDVRKSRLEPVRTRSAQTKLFA